MKKLMIAAAIVCAAALSHGAIVKWSETNIYDEKGTALITAANGYNVYLFTTAAVALNTWNADNFAANIAKGYELGVTDAGKSANTTGIQHTVINAGSALNLLTDSSYDFYTVAVNGDGSRYYISNVKEDMPISGTASDVTNLSFLSQKTATQNKTDAWQTVPEPTSGLLLLLGVAGLALRRRRA